MVCAGAALDAHRRAGRHVLWRVQAFELLAFFDQRGQMHAAWIEAVNEAVRLHRRCVVDSHDATRREMAKRLSPDGLNHSARNTVGARSLFGRWLAKIAENCMAALTFGVGMVCVLMVPSLLICAEPLVYRRAGLAVLLLCSVLAIQRVTGLPHSTRSGVPW